MFNPKIEIKSVDEKDGSLFTEIYVNGHKLEGVRRFKLEREVGDSIPTLTVDLNALQLSVDHRCLLRASGVGNIEDIKFS